MIRSLSGTAEDQKLEDVQSKVDTRRIAIQKTGVKGLRYPLHFQDKSGIAQATIASIDMYVGLPETVKGTHMSRFVEIMEAYNQALSVEKIGDLLQSIATRLDANSAFIEIRFPYFIKKAAPVSGVESMMDYEVEIKGDFKDGQTQISLRTVIPVTSLCPCSKEISAYGAHNQRSHVTIQARKKESAEIVWVEELIQLAEDCASCELYGLLKRPDEKYVTEKAYDNPKFVEDMVRDLAHALNEDVRIASYVIESENFESIHNHSAYAKIEATKE